MRLIVTNEISSYLRRNDDVFEVLISRYGLLEIELWDDLYRSIVFHIIGQMLSASVAEKIQERITVLCGGEIDAEILSKLNREDLRKCGLSYAKVDFIQSFSVNYLNKKYDFSLLQDMTDEEAILYLRRIDGVGKWTAEMLALFSLGRPNIFSFDDVALRNGIMKSKHYKTLSKKRFESLRKKYSPFCSYASLYFYKCNDDKNF